MIDAWIYYNFAATIWAYGIFEWKIKGPVARIGMVIFFPQVVTFLALGIDLKDLKNGKAQNKKGS